MFFIYKMSPMSVGHCRSWVVNGEIGSGY